jgi:hypothetical protein
VLSYFMLDTATGTHTDFATFDALRATVAPMNVQVHLEPIDVEYGRARRARPPLSRRPAPLPPELKVVAQADFGRPCDLNPSFVRVARHPDGAAPISVDKPTYRDLSR